MAFAGNPATIFGLFTLIGVGMAAPYWLVVFSQFGARPTAARAMDVLGQIIMGLLLLGFALFLIWVLMAQLGVWVASLRSV